MLEAEQLRTTGEVISFAEARERAAVEDTFLLIGLDSRAARALRVLIDRLLSRADLASLARRVTAFEVARQGDGPTRGDRRATSTDGLDAAAVWRELRYSPILGRGQASGRVGLVQLGEAIWSSSAGSPDVVVVFIGSAQPDRQQELATFRDVAASGYAAISSALGLTRSLAVFVTRGQVSTLDNELSSSADSTDALPPPLVILELAGGGALAPEEIARNATAEFLELLIEAGPVRLLGVDWGAARDPGTALVVAMDAIEVPGDLEARYLSARLRRAWLDRLLFESEQEGEAASVEADAAAAQIISLVEDDHRRLSGPIRRIVRDEGRRAALDVDPRVLRELSPNVWSHVIGRANARLADPEGPMARVRFGLARLFDREARAPAAARDLAARFLSSPRRGPLEAERALASATSWLEHRAHSTLALIEPVLRLDADELTRVELDPPGAHARSLLAWTALLGLAAFAVSEAAGPGGTWDLLIDAIGLAVLATLLWQSIVILRFGFRLRSAAGRPSARIRDLFDAWASWSLQRELHWRSFVAVGELLDEMVMLRERLTRSHRHLLSEERRLRRRLTEPAFPARLSHVGADLEEMSRELEDRIGPPWLFFQAGEGDGDPHSRGRWIASLLESSIVGGSAGAAAASVAQCADAAVSELLEARSPDSLDKKLVDPVQMFSTLRRRATSTGDHVVGRFLCADPRSSLRHMATRTGYVAIPRHDPDRAAVVVVSRRALSDRAW